MCYRRPSLSEEPGQFSQGLPVDLLTGHIPKDIIVLVGVPHDSGSVANIHCRCCAGQGCSPGGVPWGVKDELGTRRAVGERPGPWVGL